jgi:SAM-dependent methyltransferase
MNHVADNYKDEIKSRVLDEEQFVRLTMKGKVRDHTIPCPWHQVIVRPVMIKNERHLQFSYFTNKQDFTKNYKGVQAVEKLDELLALPLSVLSIQSKDEDLLVQITKKGKAIFHRSVPASSKREPDLAHDVSKKLPLPADKPDAFLQTIGIMNEQGKVRPTMQAKFSQINEFLKLLDHTGELERLEKRPVHILDCGCGSAYLSLATYHYLNNIRGIPAHLVGVDVNETLIEKDNASSEQLGFTDACFQKSAIRDYKPEVPPEIVLALHACDTATDEAIAQAIVWQSRLILCAPCCHHDLNQQLHATGPDPFSPVLRHGILKERMADILTDAFRALVLRIMGYATDVVEFISPEHTDKNLMIRAVRRANLDNAEFVREYVALKEFRGVTPYIEGLLGERLTTLIHLSSLVNDINHMK